jgi:cytochrome b561
MKKVAPQTPQKYHPALVALHWAIALLIFANVVLGGASEDGGTGPGGIPIINFHMSLGITILVLMFARLVVRLKTKHPSWADTGNAFLNKIGELTHWALYILAIGMPLTGILLARDNDELRLLFGSAAGLVPSIGLGRIHGLIWALLLLLILLHFGAAMFHQFFIKDNLLKRMTFGKK